MASINTVLHIGIGKAGSSTIQKFFSYFRKELVKKYVLSI